MCLHYCFWKIVIQLTEYNTIVAIGGFPWTDTPYPKSIVALSRPQYAQTEANPHRVQASRWLVQALHMRPGLHEQNPTTLLLGDAPTMRKHQAG